MKRYITIALVFTMFMINSLCMVCSAEEKQFSDTTQKSSFLFTKLGILDEKSLGSTVTRSDFMRYFVNYLGKGSSVGSQYNLYYTDVKYEDKNSAQISYLTDEGYVNGYGDNLFYPDKNITVVQVVKMIEIATGYDTLLKEDTNSEYLRVARMMKIIDGATFSDFSNDATFGDIALILYNALTIDFVDTSVIYNDSVTYKKAEGKTILSDFLNLEKYEGIITANSYTNLKGAYATEDTVVVNQKALRTVENKELELELGKYAEVYVDNDSNIVKGYCTVESKTNILEINSRLISNKYENSVEYKKDEDSDHIVKIKINSNAYAIFNGKYDGMFSSYSLSDIKFDTGYIKFIDYDNDNTFDVAIIQKYEVFVADAVGADFITFKYGKALNGLAKITLDENTNYIIKLDNELAELKDLVEYDVLNIAQSKDKSYTEVAVYFKRIEGSVAEVGNSSKGETAKISGSTYIISKSYLALHDEEAVPITLDLRGTFYCDYNGHIAAVNVDNGAKYKYGYLKGVRYDDKQELAQIRIFTTAGTFENIFIKEKSKLYSVSYKAGITPKPEEYTTLLKKENGNCYQPIMYLTDSKGEINEIYLEADNISVDNSDYDFTKDYYATGGNRQYATVYRGLLAQLYKIPTNVPILYIPADKENEKLYQSKTTLNIPGIQCYNFDSGISVYNADEFNLIPQLLITEGSTTTDGVDDLKKICIVDSKVQLLNDNGDVIEGIRVYEGGRIVTLKQPDGDEIASNEKLPNAGNTALYDWYYGTKVSDLQKGDIIQYELSQSGEIAKIRVLFRPSNPGPYNMKYGTKSEINSELTDLPYVSMLVVAYGEVIRCKGSAVRMTINEGGDEWLFWISSANVTLFDSSTNSISASSANEIQPGDKIVVRKGQDESADDVVIIR